MWWLVLGCVPGFPPAPAFLDNPGHDFDGDGFTEGEGDCADARAETWPGAPEICDGLDNDCDGSTDPTDSEGCVQYYYDYDQDGYGLSNMNTCECSGSGYYTATESGDCDDVDALVNSGAGNCGLMGTIDVSAADGVFTASGAASDFGAWGTIAGGEDLNQDGWADLVFSSPDANSYTGEIYVSYGPHTGGAIDLSVHADVTLTGSGPGAYAGGVNVSSDLSGDGVGDLIARDSGIFYVSSIGPGAGQVLPSMAHTVLVPRYPAYWCGSDDWNGDGNDDLAFGKTGYSILDVSLGPVSPGAYDASFRDYQFSATGIGGSGDVDGDGTHDILVFYNNVVTTYSGFGVGVLVSLGTVTDSRASPHLMYGNGSRMDNNATVADVNGDGSNDLLIGDYSANVTAYSDGAVFVFIGPISGTVSSADFVVSG